MLFLNVFAPSVKYDGRSYEEMIRKELFDQRKEILLKAIIKAERPNSLEQAKAARLREDAVGVLQIRPVMVRACNEILGYQKYFLNDRNDSIRSVEMFYLFQNHFNPDFNPEIAAYLWNGGEGFKKANNRTKRALSIYWMKVNINLKNLNDHATK